MSLKLRLALLPLATLMTMTPAAAQGGDPALAGALDTAAAQTDGAASTDGALMGRPGSSLDDAQRTKLHEALAGGASYKARIHAAMLLGRLGAADEDLFALTDALENDPEHTVRGSAAMAIGNLGAPRGVESLLGAFADGDLFVRKAAKEAARKLAEAGAIPYLEVARERESPLVRVTAVYILADIDHPEARAAIAEFLGDTNPEVRAVVEQLLEEWPSEERVAAILAAVAHPSYRVRAHAARLAALYPDARFVDVLAERLSEPLEEASVQIAASESLGQLRDYMDSEDLIKRVQGLVDRDARVQGILLLGVRGGPRAVDVLIQTLQDPDVGIRGHAAMALGRTGDRRAVPHLQRLHDQPENRRIRGVLRASLQDLSRAP